PAHVARDRPRRERLDQVPDEARDVRLPRMAAEPGAEAVVAELRQVEVPVERLALHRRRAAHLAAGVRHPERVELLPAARALVAARHLVPALVAGAEDVAIGEEHLVLRAVELLARLLLEVAVHVETAEELLARRSVLGADARAGPDVEDDPEAVERALDL